MPGGLVEMPKRVPLDMSGGPEVSKFEKRKKKAKIGQTRVLVDAAHTCDIDVGENGQLLYCYMSDDLNKTYIQFGQEVRGQFPAIKLAQSGVIDAAIRKKPFVKSAPLDLRYTGEGVYYDPMELLSGMGQNKKYKKIKVKKQKLRGKKAKRDLLFAADKADLIVEEYTDKVGKIYVAIPDMQYHRTYLFGLPERVKVITEEFSQDIPVVRATNDKANWYVQDTSSEESEEDYTSKPKMAEASAAAADEHFQPPPPPSGAGRFSNPLGGASGYGNYHQPSPQNRRY